MRANSCSRRCRDPPIFGNKYFSNRGKGLRAKTDSLILVPTYLPEQENENRFAADDSVSGFRSAACGNEHQPDAYVQRADRNIAG